MDKLFDFALRPQIDGIEQLYYRKSADGFTFDTYFNGIPIKKLRKYTTIRELQFSQNVEILTEQDSLRYDRSIGIGEIPIDARMLYLKTAETFQNHQEIDAILIVCVKPYLEYIWEMKEKYGLSKPKWVCEGGDTFQGSVLNGVNYLNGKIDRNDIVLFHFGASPFITDDII